MCYIKGMDNDYRLPERLKSRRKELGLTLAQVADRVGTSEATVQRWENGSIKTLRHESIVKLAEVLDVTPAYLMGWEEPEQSIDDLQNLLKDNPKLRMLLSASSKLNESDIEQLYRIASLMGKE